MPRLLTHQHLTNSPAAEFYCNHVPLQQSYSVIMAYVPLTGQANLQDKVDTLRDKVINIEEKLDTFQNTTEVSTQKNHHEVVELLQNTWCTLDGKIYNLIWNSIFDQYSGQ